MSSPTLEHTRGRKRTVPFHRQESQGLSGQLSPPQICRPSSLSLCCYGFSVVSSGRDLKSQGNSSPVLPSRVEVTISRARRESASPAAEPRPRALLFLQLQKLLMGSGLGDATFLSRNLSA